MKTLILTLLAFFFASISVFANCENCPSSLSEQNSSNCYYIHTSSGGHLPYCSSCDSQLSPLPSGLCKLYIMDKGIPVTCNYSGCTCCPGGFTPPSTGCSHPCSGKGWVCPVCTQTFCSSHDNHVYYNSPCPAGVTHKKCGSSPLSAPFTTSTCSTCGVSFCSVCGHECVPAVCSHPCSGKGWVCPVCNRTFCSLHDDHASKISTCPSGVEHKKCGTPPVDDPFTLIACPDCNQTYCSVCGHGSQKKCSICGYWYCGDSCPHIHNTCSLCNKTIVDSSLHNLTCPLCQERYCGSGHVCECKKPCPDYSLTCPVCHKIFCSKHDKHTYDSYICVSGKEHFFCGQPPLAIRRSTAKCSAGHEYCTYCGHNCDVDPHEPQNPDSADDLSGVMDSLSKIIENQNTANSYLSKTDDHFKNQASYLDKFLENDIYKKNSLDYLSQNSGSINDKLNTTNDTLQDILDLGGIFENSLDSVNWGIDDINSNLTSIDSNISNSNDKLDNINSGVGDLNSGLDITNEKLQNIDDTLTNLNNFFTQDNGESFSPYPVDITERSEWSDSIDEITRKLLPDFSLSASGSSDLSWRVPLDLTSLCGRDFSFTIGGWSTLADGKFMWLASICKSISIFVFSLIFVRAVINALRQW